jgi:hypothetical protein
MKAIVLMAVMTAFVLLFSSCGHKLGKIVGLFTVIEKTPLFSDVQDRGDVKLVSSESDTVEVSVSMASVYLNTKVGDEVFLHESPDGGLRIQSKNSMFKIGYCKVISKADQPKLLFDVVSRGGDTVAVKLFRTLFITVPESETPCM